MRSTRMTGDKLWGEKIGGAVGGGVITYRRRRRNGRRRDRSYGNPVADGDHDRQSFDSRPRVGRASRHEHGGPSEPASAQVVERLVGPLERERTVVWTFARGASARNSCAVGAGEIGDRDEAAFLPENGVGEGRDVAHVDAAADHGPALAHGLERGGNQRADRRKDDGGVERFRRAIVGAARPSAPSYRANSCAAVSPGRVKAKTRRPWQRPPGS